MNPTDMIGKRIILSGATYKLASEVATPELQASHEWEHEPARRKGFASKQLYVAARAAELRQHGH